LTGISGCSVTRLWRCSLRVGPCDSSGVCRLSRRRSRRSVSPKPYPVVGRVVPSGRSELINWENGGQGIESAYGEGAVKEYLPWYWDFGMSTLFQTQYQGAANFIIGPTDRELEMAERESKDRESRRQNGESQCVSGALFKCLNSVSLIPIVPTRKLFM